jgi:peptide/nickel transport system substrate-binding protein
VQRSTSESAFRWRSAALAACLVLGLAACGGDDDASEPTAADAAEPTTAEAPEPTTADAAEPTTAEAPEPTTADAAEPTTAEAPEPTTAESEPVPGGKLVVLTQADARFGWDPAKTVGLVNNDGYNFPIVYDTLVQANSDGEIVPRLAESVTTDDNQVWNVTLRPGLVFSDGTALDAEAVKFNWERHADPELQSTGAAIVGQIESIEVVSDLELVFTLLEPRPSFIENLEASPLAFIASPTAIQEQGESFGVDEPVGAGPFLLEEWIRDSTATYVRNPTFWDAPRPYIDELEVRMVVDQQQRYDTLISGAADVEFTGVTSSQLNDLRANDDYTEYSIGFFGGVGIAFDLDVPELQDVRLRRALAMAIDLDELDLLASDGAATMAPTMFPENSPWYTGQEFPFGDLEGAQELIDELVAEKGEPYSFEFRVTEQITNWGEPILQQWNRLDGLDINYNVVASSASGLANSDFRVNFSSSTGVDPDRLYDDYHTNGGRNRVSYSDPDMDAALDRGRLATDPEERRAAYDEALSILVRDVPFFPLYRPDQTHFASDRVQGIKTFSTGFVSWSDVWLSDQ